MLCTKRIRTVVTSGASTPQQTSSANAIACNDDLLIEILLHFPIRSLLKFKSVSKHWLSLISDPHFSRRRNLIPNPVSGIFLLIPCRNFYPEYEFIPLGGEPSTSPPFRSLTFVDDPAGIRILQSCNGLLCCCSKLEGGSERKYYICNPTTQQFTVLPELVGSVLNPVVGVGLAFDPSKSFHYKVVCVRRYNNVPNCYRFEIYSSESGSWRQSGDPFTAPGDNFDDGVFWNGAIHWINNLGIRICNLGTIVSFDVDQEQLREMPIPDDWSQTRIRYFGASQDHLHLILTNSLDTAQFNVYESEKDYSRWFVKYRVDLDAVTTSFPEIRKSYSIPSNKLFYAFSILCLVREDNDEESFLVLRIPGKALGYSFKDNTFKKLCDLAQSYSTVGWHLAHQYIESLACV